MGRGSAGVRLNHMHRAGVLRCREQEEEGGKCGTKSERCNLPTMPLSHSQSIFHFHPLPSHTCMSLQPCMSLSQTLSLLFSLTPFSVPSFHTCIKVCSRAPLLALQMRTLLSEMAPRSWWGRREEGERKVGGRWEEGERKVGGSERKVGDEEGERGGGWCKRVFVLASGASSEVREGSCYSFLSSFLRSFIPSFLRSLEATEVRESSWVQGVWGGAVAHQLRVAAPSDLIERGAGLWPHGPPGAVARAPWERGPCTRTSGSGSGSSSGRGLCCLADDDQGNAP